MAGCEKMFYPFFLIFFFLIQILLQYLFYNPLTTLNHVIISFKHCAEIINKGTFYAIVGLEMNKQKNKFVGKNKENESLN